MTRGERRGLAETAGGHGGFEKRTVYVAGDWNACSASWFPWQRRERCAGHPQMKRPEAKLTNFGSRLQFDSARFGRGPRIFHDGLTDESAEPLWLC
jgi:hypothetical protein